MHGEIARRATLVVISPQQLEHSRSISDDLGLQFPILWDPGNRVARAFGVRLALSYEVREAHLSIGLDLASFNGDDSWTLPIPSSFVIDAAGVVRSVATSEDDTRRPSAETILAALEALDS